MTAPRADDRQDNEVNGILDLQRTGPGTLAGRFMRRFWQPVHRVEDLPPGRAKPIRIMSEDFTLYRGETGAAYLVAFRCAHRGTQLSTGWVEGDTLRCFYHGWVYDGDGQCVEQPAEPEPFCSRIKIKAYPVQEYLGLIFAYLGEGEAPELPRYPEFDSTPDLLRTGAYIRDSNFFTQIDNVFDHAHVPFVHRFRDEYRGGQGYAEESDWGVAERIVERDGRERYSHFGMPNMCQLRTNLSGGRPSMQWLVPIDDTRHWNFGLNAGRTPEEAAVLQADPGFEDPEMRRFIVEQTYAVLEGRLVIEEAMSPTGRRANVNIQDNVAQVGQMGGPAYVPDFRAEHLGREDVGLILVRQLWMRELHALAAGAPLKEWRHPGSLTWGTPLAVLAGQP
jgi:5,5'-dehydrodivanillate O-demethylase